MTGIAEATIKMSWSNGSKGKQQTLSEAGTRVDPVIHDPPSANKSWTFSTQCEEEWPFQNITSRVPKGCPPSCCIGAGRVQTPGLYTTKTHHSETNLCSGGRKAPTRWVLLPKKQEASILPAFAITIYIAEVLTQKTKSQINVAIRISFPSCRQKEEPY